MSSSRAEMPSSPLQKEVAENHVEKNASMRGAEADVPDTPQATELEIFRLTSQGKPIPPWLAERATKHGLSVL